MPRDVRNASNGPETAPAANWVNVTRSATSARSSPAPNTSAPPMTSECPPRYFVVECTTTSAPSSSGCCRAGEANVLSTTTSAPASLPSSRERRDVADLHERVRGRLDPEHLGGAELDRGAHRVEVARVDGRVPHAPVAEDAADEPVRAAVDVVADDDVVAGHQHGAQQRVFGGEARREREPARTALERGELRLERGARGVAAARVLVAAAQAADAVLHVRRGRVDRAG